MFINYDSMNQETAVSVKFLHRSNYYMPLDILYFASPLFLLLGKKHNCDKSLQCPKRHIRKIFI